MFSEVAEIALVAARLGQFQQLPKTRVILILNFTRPHAITYTYPFWCTYGVCGHLTGELIDHCQSHFVNSDSAEPILLFQDHFMFQAGFLKTLRFQLHSPLDEEGFYSNWRVENLLSSNLTC